MLAPLRSLWTNYSYVTINSPSLRNDKSTVRRNIRNALRVTINRLDPGQGLDFKADPFTVRPLFALVGVLFHAREVHPHICDRRAAASGEAMFCLRLDRREGVGVL